jgi:pyridinium-3,5-bisthiocarboxylic acid mononucleotide nickel chelatase
LRALYFDCFSGASGDMILAALLDAGASLDEVRRNLDALGLQWSLEVSQVQRGPLRSTRAEVTVDEDGTERSHGDIVAMLDAAALDASVKERAESVFAVLAGAEGRIHATSPDDVSFHEVGSLDAIIDIVGCCAALESFLPARVVCSPIATGTGTVETSHGVLPLPAPAVTEILQACGGTLVARGERELITPTGAALLAVFVDNFGAMPSMTVERAGYGAGAANTDVPNVLRVLTGEVMKELDADPDSSHSPDSSILIETNLDDMAPELLPHVIDSLLEAGAQDAWVTPIVMKKGRPGITLTALCAPVKKFHMMEIIFRETTTLGIRVTAVHRAIADRHWADVEVAGEKVRVKIGSRNGDVIGAAPEYEDVLAAAKATGLPLKEIYARALHKAMDRLDSDS